MHSKSRLLIRVVLLLASHSAVGQKITVGPKVMLPLGTSTHADTRVEGVSIQGGDSQTGGTHPGLFARADWKRFYLQAEASRSRSWHAFYLSGGNGGYGHYPTNRRTGLNLTGGVKPLPWLRLHAGLSSVHRRWDEPSPLSGYYQNEANMPEDPARQAYFLAEQEMQRVNYQFDKSFRKWNLEGQLGVGVDLQGFTVDLVRHGGLTPLADGLEYRGQRYSFRPKYDFWALHFGYRLLPLKRYLLRPRKPKTERDSLPPVRLPFYRNEVSLVAGMLGEDLGGAFIYENRYTRFVKQWLGVSGSVNLMRSYQDAETGWLPQAYNAFSVNVSLSLLPLRTRRHVLSLAAGPTFMLLSGLHPYSGGSYPGPAGTLMVYSTARYRDAGLGYQATIEYGFLPTYRIPVGFWVRASNNVYDSFASFGIHTGYRF